MTLPACQVAEQGTTRIAAEETPLYLFDQEFGTKVPEMEGQFSVPEYFNEDLFGLLGPRPLRPAYRWLIVG